MKNKKCITVFICFGHFICTPHPRQRTSVHICECIKMEPEIMILCLICLFTVAATPYCTLFIFFPFASLKFIDGLKFWPPVFNNIKILSIILKVFGVPPNILRVVRWKKNKYHHFFFFSVSDFQPSISNFCI